MTLVFSLMRSAAVSNLRPVYYTRKGGTDDSGTSTNNRTDEMEYYMQRWTDVCLKDGGKWYWISDHGVDISGAE